MPEEASLLIVDDDEDMLETLSDILQEKGYKTETTKTGKEAIKKAKQQFFNVALIDLKLPDITGIEVLRTFRKKYPARMNIMITGHATVQNAVDALNQGANAYIMKPIDPERLDQMIKQCNKKQQEILKITQEKLVDFVEKAMESTWKKHKQRWKSRKQKPKKLK